MKKWRPIIRLIAQVAVVVLLIKAMSAPVRWERPQSGGQ